MAVALKPTIPCPVDLLTRLSSASLLSSDPLLPRLSLFPSQHCAITLACSP